MKPTEVKTTDWWQYNILFFLEHWMGYKLFVKYLGVRQKKLYQKIDRYLAAAGVPTDQVLPLPEVDRNISDNDFERISYDGPKVFRAAAKDWESVQKWGLDFFEENYGDVEIIIMDNVGLTNNEYEKMPFREYISQLRKGTHKYLKFSDLVHDHPELKEMFNLKWLRKLKALPLSWGEDTRFFMGDKKTFTPLHVGFSNFLFTQVVGKKKWIFYAPNNRMFLDARTERTTYLFSHANPYNLNDPNFPLLKYATRYEVVLEPGDVVWVPSFTWHYVENPTMSIALRYGRASMVTGLKSSKVFTLLMFLVTKPLIFEHMFISFFKKRDSVFLKSQTQLNKEELLNRLKLQKQELRSVINKAYHQSAEASSNEVPEYEARGNKKAG